MSIQEQARKLMVEERQQSEQLQENLLTRAAEEPTTEEAQERARELLAAERQESEQLQETMLSRTTEEIQ